jgi:CTP:phosphocholine cytidylyltransferase-like protein
MQSNYFGIAFSISMNIFFFWLNTSKIQETKKNLEKKYMEELKNLKNYLEEVIKKKILTLNSKIEQQEGSLKKIFKTELESSQEILGKKLVENIKTLLGESLKEFSDDFKTRKKRIALLEKKAFLTQE